MDALVCSLCPRHCSLVSGQIGACRARKNVGEAICGLNYGRITSLALDPIEKKPLMRFHPGNYILSVGGFGCNLHCPFCQNFTISTAGEDFPTQELSPEALANLAQNLAAKSPGNLGVAFTYNEPLINFEYVLETAKLLTARGLHTVLVTNGFVEEAPFRELIPYVSALNIDLKGFKPEFYRWVGGDFAVVCRNIEIAAKATHVEVTTLIIPGENDSPADMAAEARWLTGINPELPLHVSRFFPRHRLTDREATPVQTVYALAEVAKRYLKYVYTGNC